MIKKEIVESLKNCFCVAAKSLDSARADQDMGRTTEKKHFYCKINTCPNYDV